MQTQSTLQKWKAQKQQAIDQCKHVKTGTYDSTITIQKVLDSLYSYGTGTCIDLKMISPLVTPIILHAKTIFSCSPSSGWGCEILKAYVVLALCAEAGCCAQWQRIPAVPNRRVSPWCAQLLSIPAVPSRKVSLQRATAEYSCSAQQQSIPAVPNPTVSRHCSMAKCPCRAQPLQCRTLQHLPLPCQTALLLHCICTAARKTYYSCAITPLGWGCSK